MTSTQILRMNGLTQDSIVRQSVVKPMVKTETNVSAIRRLIAKLGGK